MGNREKIKIHLGCGKRNIPGFINVDIVKLPHIDYVRDIKDLSIFKNNSAELIYASHVLEYFDRVEAKKVLKEWRRVLDPGGTLRLSVPDLVQLIKVYKKSKDISKILGPLFGRWQSGNKLVYHKTVYDFGSLKEVLESAGFIKIHRYNWRNTLHKDYDDYSQAYYPHMDKEKGLLISLNIECKKP